jgi:hypothetical protein
MNIIIIGMKSQSRQINCQEDELNGQTYPHKQSFALLKTTSVTIASALHAFHQRHYDFAFCNAVVLFTSVNYWRDPKSTCMRRYIDIAVVCSSLIYHLCVAFQSQRALQYYTITILGMCFYHLGCVHYNDKDYWRSAYSHSVLHILANLAQIVLYSGTIVAPYRLIMPQLILANPHH